MNSIQPWYATSFPSPLYSPYMLQPEVYLNPKELQKALRQDLQVYLEFFRYAVQTNDVIAQISLALAFADAFLNCDYEDEYTGCNGTRNIQSLNDRFYKGWEVIFQRAFPYKTRDDLEELCEKSLHAAAHQNFLEAQLLIFPRFKLETYNDPIALRCFFRGDQSLYLIAFRFAVETNNAPAEIALTLAYVAGLCDRDRMKDFTNPHLSLKNYFLCKNTQIFYASMYKKTFPHASEEEMKNHYERSLISAHEKNLLNAKLTTLLSFPLFTKNQHLQTCIFARLKELAEAGCSEAMFRYGWIGLRENNNMVHFLYKSGFVTKINANWTETTHDLLNRYIDNLPE